MGEYEVFSAGWAEAWREALNANETYRRAAAAWEGAVALVMHPDASSGVRERRAVYLEPFRGGCRAARVASEADLAAAEYVFEAEAGVWRDLLTSGGSPFMALITGRLALTRGRLSALLPFAAAANELMATALHVRSEFPAR